MNLLGRLFVAGLALLLAISTSTGVLVLALLVDPVAGAWLTAGALAGLDGALSDLSAGLPPEGLALLLAGLARALFWLLVVPPVLVAALGETLRLRGLAWYGAGCGLLTASLPWLGRGAARPGSAPLAEARLTAILFLAGAAAGLVYWLVAGRHDGPDEARARQPGSGHR
ncbi:hypothetical protein [Methylobacterium radiodurans]|uniref:Uncharacterized protein n=1 Tax=Methylobacterium radiodurans TaxID=2202828 RepID=A0A2U8VNS3_9HYPH|nr:hypothetical protein [Methylobacterium radiodurans]AWN35339.1 hypothetical protein DK427_05990 [Methylobacterium radiodurans]